MININSNRFVPGSAEAVAKELRAFGFQAKVSAVNADWTFQTDTDEESDAADEACGGGLEAAGYARPAGFC